VCRVYSVSTDNILVRICVVYSVFTTEYDVVYDDLEGFFPFSKQRPWKMSSSVKLCIQL
jgi:hypothetical protein